MPREDQGPGAYPAERPEGTVGQGQPSGAPGSAPRAAACSYSRPCAAAGALASLHPVLRLTLAMLLR